MGLLDIFRSKPQKEPDPPMGEVAFAGSGIYGNTPFHTYDPDILKTRKGYGVYDAMMGDDQVKAVMRFKQYAVLSRSFFFDVETGDDGEPIPESQDMADFFEFVTKAVDGSWSDKLMGILSALIQGFSLCEKVYQPVQYDGKTMWGLKDIKLREQKTFDGGFKTDPHGNLVEIKQMVGGKEITLPTDKAIHYVHQPDKNSHYGESDLRACYRAYWSKDICIRFQNIHLERHAGGFIWAKVQGNLSSDQKNDLQDVIKNVSARTGIILPHTVDLNEQSPMKTDLYERAIAQYDRAIAKAVLVPNLIGITEQGDVGSYSQSQTQVEAFFWVLDHIAKRLEEALNEQVFRQLARWNFGTDEFPPFSFEPISEDQKMKIASAWAELVSKGAATKSDSDEAYLRRLIGFPEKAEEEIEEPGEEIPEDVAAEVGDWVDGLPEERQQFVRAELAERPWLKRVNFARIEKYMDRRDEQFKQDLADLLAQTRQKIEKQIVKIVGERSLGNLKPQEIDEVEFPKGLLSDIRRTIRQNLQKTLDDSYEAARSELPKKVKAKQIRAGMDKTKAERFLSSKAMKIAGIISQDVLKNVGQVLENGLKYDKTLKETMTQLSTETSVVELLPPVDAGGKAINVPARLENIVRTNTADAVNQARLSLFGQPEFDGFVQAFEYSAVLDDRTTDICEHLNGKVLRDFGEYTPPNHYQCRSLLVPVTVVDKWDGKESSRPRLQPHKGFG